MVLELIVVLDWLEVRTNIAETCLFSFQDYTVTVPASHRSCGGVIHCCFTPDSRCVLTVGGDGTLSCWAWDFSDKGKSRAAAAVDFARARYSQILELRKEQDAAMKALNQLSWDEEIGKHSGDW